MSFYSYPLERLAESAEQWAKALRTLPDVQLRGEAAALERDCSDGRTGDPKALLLSLYNREIERRRQPGELPL